jgi:hypothetical protein
MADGVRIGRPPARFETVQVALRLESMLLDRLNAEAEINGNSLSAEIRARLWTSFDTTPEAEAYVQAWTTQ